MMSVGMAKDEEDVVQKTAVDGAVEQVWTTALWCQLCPVKDSHPV